MEKKGGGVLMQRYELGKLLGQGTFAKVYHARNLKTGTSVAIKIIDKEKILKVGMSDQIKREISVMRLVNHPNIVQLFEVMASKTKIYFVMEYVNGGELFDKVAKGRLKEDVARKYFQQLICAVDFCHSRGVYHRDLKPENLLLDEYGNLKVSDFGLSALAESKRQDGLLHTTCGTPAYVAPEVINRRGYDGSKADIWSCGVILFVLLAGYLPFKDPNLMGMYRKIGKAEYKCPNWFSPDVRGLISKILDPNPKTRITIQKIMEHSWFRKAFECNKSSRNDVDPIHDHYCVEGPGPIVDSDTKMMAEAKQEYWAKPTNVNAFDIISFSAGFDLSGLFEEKEQEKLVRFISQQPAESIISKMEEVGNRLKMKIMKKGEGMLRLQGISRQDGKGALSMEVEIFEVTPTFHVVEVKKSSGDTLEYQKMMKQDIRPALKDIVWTWQGDEPTNNQQQQQQLEQPEPEPSLCGC